MLIQSTPRAKTLLKKNNGDDHDRKFLENVYNGGGSRRNIIEMNDLHIRLHYLAGSLFSGSPLAFFVCVSFNKR